MQVSVLTIDIFIPSGGQIGNRGPTARVPFVGNPFQALRGFPAQPRCREHFVRVAFAPQGQIGFGPAQECILTLLSKETAEGKS